MANPELEKSELEEDIEPENPFSKRPLLKRLWSNREVLLVCGFCVFGVASYSFAAASFASQPFEVVNPQLFDLSANLFKVTLAFGGLYLTSRLARAAASILIETLRDIDTLVKH